MDWLTSAGLQLLGLVLGCLLIGGAVMALQAALPRAGATLATMGAVVVALALLGGVLSE